MRSLYKSALAVLLILATLFSVAGCRAKRPELMDPDCFEKFMDAVCALDFSAAYSYLSKVSTTEPTPVPTAEPERMGVEVTPDPNATQKPDEYITAEAFIKKYESIFSALGVTAVSYEKLSEEEDGDTLTVKYSASYETKIAGVLTNEYEMTLVREDDHRRVLWTPALIFPGMTWGSTVRVNRIAAKRGDILASGELLAQTVTTSAAVADKDAIQDTDAFCAAAAEILGMTPEEIAEKLEKAAGKTVLLAQYSEKELSPDVHQGIDELEGAYMIKNYGTYRYYPQGELLAHTIGYVGYVEESELASLNEGRTETDGLYTVHSIVGRSGLERAYESVLRGKDGLTVTIRDENGELVSTVYKKPVEDGPDLHLTIDLKLQKRAEQLIDLVLWGDDTAGAIVVMNPTNGEVKALVSYPSYDLNQIAISANAEYYDKISKQANKPLQNRDTLGLYAPGSAMKTFTAAAALELGTVTPDYIFKGKIVDDYWTPTEYGRWVWPPIKRTELKKRTEPMNMANCLLHSDNIYFANLALMMGEDDFFAYLRRIGFEQSFPFELSVARSTLKVKFDDPNYWNLRSIAETGYGQGQVTISPLQLATMYCAFRHNGDIPVPRVSKALYRTEGIEYKPIKTFESGIWIEDAFEEGTIETLLPMMKNIMSREYNGTGRRLRARGCTVAGKTGTAEIGSEKAREISWFVGFRVDVPEEDELLVLVMVEIPTADEYKYLKFDIARELISMDEPEEPKE
ncbi:MAG: hypothetical protein K6G56_04290 [Clostridiales bacterium]|nr:hypothetical protein [Clostridiales bacterium]